MPVDLKKATVENIRIEFEKAPHDSHFGVVQWAKVIVEFSVPTLAPDIQIAVPVVWEDGKTLAEVRREIYSGAVDLLAHLNLDTEGKDWQTESLS